MTNTEVFASAYVLQCREEEFVGRKPSIYSLLQVQIGMYGMVYAVTMTAKDAADFDLFRPALSVKWFREKELAETFYEETENSKEELSWDDKLRVEEARLIARQGGGSHFSCEFPAKAIPPRPEKNARRP